MHTEVIRANPDWRGKCSRFDTVLVQTNSEEPGIKGTRVARVLAFLSVHHPRKDERIPCAVVEWFNLQGGRPSSITGMWVVKPAAVGGRKVWGIVHLDSIIRSVHLLPVFRGITIPIDFHFSNSLDAFTSFYINKYADYHTHECIY